MGTATSQYHDHTGAVYQRHKLFILSVIALVTAGMAFSLRGASLTQLQATFFTPFDPIHATELATAAIGAAFLGFAVSVLIGSPLCDSLGMGRLLGISSLLFIVGTFGTVFTPVSASAGTTLKMFFFIIGLAHGLVEAVINPLIATIYPNDKTHKLNVLHAWWPGGLIIGGLIGSVAGLDYNVKLGLVLLPAVIFGFMLIGTKFPPTERAAAGVSNSDMFKEATKPLFLLLLGAMLLTASAELAPGQWVDSALTRTVHFQGILLLVYVSGLMFVMRFFAGPIAHKLSPIGLMFISCLLAALGLVALAKADSPVTGLLAATLWGTGVCYMWPTMLAITSERFPRGGAFLMGLIGSFGNIAIYFVLPKIGQVFDQAKVAAAGGDEAFKALSGAPLNDVLVKASEKSFMFVAALPAVLLIVFGAWWLADKAKGGYKAEVLTAGQE